MTDIIDRIRTAQETRGYLPQAKELAEALLAAHAKIKAADRLAEAFTSSKITQTETTGPFIWVIVDGQKDAIDAALTAYREAGEGV